MSDEALKLGGVAFHGVPFPVVIGNRYIHLRIDDGEPVCQIWRWDPDRQVAQREPDPGEQGAGVVLRPSESGGLTLELTESATGEGLSGALEEGAVKVEFTRDQIMVWRGDEHSITVEGATLQGFEVGIVVTESAVSMGGRLPEGFDYRIDYTFRRVQIARLVHRAEEPFLRKMRFVACRIEGPAVLFPVGPLHVQGGRWDLLGAPEAARFFHLPTPSAAYGTIMVDDLRFEDCELVNIAFAMVPGA